LILRAPGHGRELEQCFFDTAVVIDVDSVLEHKIDEVGVGLDELVQLLEASQIAALLLIEDIEVVLASVQLHVLDLGRQISLLFTYLLIALLQLLFLLLK